MSKNVNNDVSKDPPIRLFISLLVYMTKVLLA